MTPPTPPPPERQRAATAVSEIARLMTFAHIDGVPLPADKIAAVVCTLDLDARTIAEEMVGKILDGLDQKTGDDFRRTIDQGFRDAMGLD